MCVGDAEVDVDSDLVGPVDELDVEAVQKLVLAKHVLEGVVLQTQDLPLVSSQLQNLFNYYSQLFSQFYVKRHYLETIILLHTPTVKTTSRLLQERIFWWRYFGEYKSILWERALRNN